MANPFFNNGNGNGGMLGNFQNMVSQFNQFRQNIQGGRLNLKWSPFLKACENSK